MFGELKQAVIVNISLTQLCFEALNKTLDNCGSSGNYAILAPYSVRFPSSSKAPK